MTSRLPPVVGLAGAFALGSAWILSGAPFFPAPLLLLSLLLPILLWRRPATAPALLAAVVAGSLWTGGWGRSVARHCLLGLKEGQRVEVSGTVVATSDRLVELAVEEGLPCRASLRVFSGSDPATTQAGTAPGRRVHVEGRWLQAAVPHRHSPERAGYLRAEAFRPEPPRGPGESEGLAPVLLRVRAGAQERIRRTLGSGAPLAEALVLARKEGISPELREGFARSGTAHLLAISGFHVGVVAGLLFVVLRWCGVRRRLAGVGAAAGVWAYVAVIGFPDAATRAAAILALVAMARLRSRPAAYAGALGTALLVLLLLDPGALARPGFQLSFAGAWGLVLWSGPVERRLRRRGGRWCPQEVRGMVAAGVAATVATLPLVAWHFDRVSLVGIPTTLVAAPLVAAAIPGLLLTLGADLVHPALSGWLGAAVEVELHALAATVRGAAGLPFASAWVSRAWLVAAGAGWGAGAGLLALAGGARRRRLRRTVLAAGAGVGLLLGPLGGQAARRGSVDVVVLDVGQGDAIAIRSPRDRWLLVDAGPASDRFDAGARIVVPFLRRQGAGSLEALVLTHADLDHIGGAAAVLEAFPVGAVVDPGRAVGKESYVGLLAVAARRGVGWWPGERGGRYGLDGMTLEVLHPRPREDPDREEDDTNAGSVVVLLRYGAFTALLTGDAPTQVEDAVAPRLRGERLELLKVGHHGSATSTGPELLEAAPPELAVVSVGRRNRYGHPHPSVVRRLEAAGTRLLRTDRHGTVRIRGRPDGSYRVSVARDRDGVP